MRFKRNLSSPKPRRDWRRKIVFRLLAVVVGLSPLFVAEVACRIFDWGKPTYYDDPYVGFSDVHPLFVLNQETQRYEISESRLKFFCPESFPARKADNEYRIFVLGGSTVQGRPWKIATSFTAWLELGLNAAEPRRKWEVVNCGGVSYASYRLVPILQECLTYQPDLIIVCTGHNEFLEDRSYAHIKQMPGYLAWPAQQIARLRTYNLVRVGLLTMMGEDPYPISDERPQLGAEAEARLDYKGGMELFHRDDVWKAKVIDHFEYNLRRMTAIAENSKIPMLFVSPVSNLDWPPSKSEHSRSLSRGEKEKYEALRAAARRAAKSSLLAAIPLYQQAAELSPRYALAQYELGQCYLQLERYAEAKPPLLKAKEEDVCPLRMLTEMQKRMNRVATDTNTPLLDAEALIVDRSPGGIPDSDWMVDHVHPKIEGHRLIAKALTEMMIDRQIVQPVAGWQVVRERYWQKHFETLTPDYFQKGEFQRQATVGWAFGKAKLEKPKDKYKK